MVAQPKKGLAVPCGLPCAFPPRTLKYWVGVQQGQSYVMGRTFFFFNWDSLHPKLNSHNEAWSYKKRNTKKITGYRKSV